MCGELIQAMYGTRDAAQNWEQEYCQFMTGIGFRRGKASPCVFYHKERNVRAVVHGDDFTILGFAKDSEWFKEHITAKWEVKLKDRIGLQPHDMKVIHVLNRIVEWTDKGIIYEADNRHTAISIDAF